SRCAKSKTWSAEAIASEDPALLATRHSPGACVMGGPAWLVQRGFLRVMSLPIDHSHEITALFRAAKISVRWLRNRKVSDRQVKAGAGHSQQILSGTEGSVIEGSVEQRPFQDVGRPGQGRDRFRGRFWPRGAARNHQRRVLGRGEID